MSAVFEALFNGELLNVLYTVSHILPSTGEIVTEVSLVQRTNAPVPMDVMLSGIVIEVNPVHLANALSPMDVTLSGMVALASFTQSSKAQYTMSVTDEGIV